jgi:hypothetical protein
MHHEQLIQTIERIVPPFVRRSGLAGPRTAPDCLELVDLAKLPAGKLPVKANDRWLLKPVGMFSPRRKHPQPVGALARSIEPWRATVDLAGAIETSTGSAVDVRSGDAA